jgi:hypothetical protein
MTTRCKQKVEVIAATRRLAKVFALSLKFVRQSESGIAA